jgi:excisionase family DNA binding protein
MATNLGDRADAPPSLVGDGFVDVAEAGRFLHLSRAKLYQLMDDHELPYAKFGKARRIPRRALLEYANRCLVGVGA